MKMLMCLFVISIAFLGASDAQFGILYPPVVVQQPPGQFYGPPGQVGYGPGNGYGQGGYGGYGGNAGWGKK